MVRSSSSRRRIDSPEEQKRQRRQSAAVFLNVYDVTPYNGYAYWLGLGVYHSGVQVHGVEYAYGAHEQETTGIFEVEPRHCPGFHFRKSIQIGRTELGPPEVRQVIEDLAGEFTGASYNLISKNCNHFCNQVCLRLASKPIPRWVNRLARIGFLCNCLLPPELNVKAVRQLEGEKTARGEEEIKKLRSNSSRFAESTSAGDRRRRTSSTAPVD